MIFRVFCFLFELLAISGPAVAGASLPPIIVPPNEQIVANRGSLNWFANSAGGGTNNYTRGEYRQKLTFGVVATSDIRICYGNYYSTSTGQTGEAAGLNPITVESGLELTSPVTTVRASWSGARTITIQPGAQVCSDPIPIDIPANGTAWLRTGVTVASGQFWPTASYFFGSSGDAFIESTSAVSQIGNTGDLTVPSGGTVASSNTGFSALAILGVPRAKTRSAIIIGDSISVGVADNGDGNGNYGFISRALVANQIPFSKLGRQSEMVQGEAGVNGILRRLYTRYATIAVTNGGTNDLLAGRSAVQIQADLTTLWRALKARGVKVYHVLLFPRTTSSDAWATPGNQAFMSGYAPGSTRDQVNAWVKAQVGILIDGYFDPSAYIEDAANPGKWASPASAALQNAPSVALTTDGTHPNPAASAALSIGLTSFFGGL